MFGLLPFFSSCLPHSIIINLRTSILWIELSFEFIIAHFILSVFAFHFYFFFVRIFFTFLCMCCDFLISIWFRLAICIFSINFSANCVISYISISFLCSFISSTFKVRSKKRENRIIFILPLFFFHYSFSIFSFLLLVLLISVF